MARRVAEIARLAELDRSLRQLRDLCQQAGTTQRTLQRMFLAYAGVSPTWVLRRYRLLDAAEAVRGGERVAWSEVAASSGTPIRRTSSAISAPPPGGPPLPMPRHRRLRRLGASGRPIGRVSASSLALRP